MTVDINTYNLLKRRASEAKADYDRAEGALEGQMRKLQEDFDCSTIEEAETLLEKLKTEEDEAEQLYERELKVFQEKWGEKL